MAELLHDILDSSRASRRDGLQRRPQVVSQIGRDADRLPVQILVSLAQSIEFPFGQVRAVLERVQTINQKLMPFHLVEFDERIEPRRPLVPRVGEVFWFVPMMGLVQGDENSLSQVLTFGKRSLQFVHPFSFASLASDDDRRGRRLSALQHGGLVVPARPRDFSCRVAPILRAHSATLFRPEKSPLCEVDDGHRT